MKAAIYPGGGQPLSVETVPDPTPAAGEVVVKVHRCGICGTDLHMTEGHMFQFPANCIPGHEYSGEVVALGKGVDGFKTGDKVTVYPSLGCGHCEACATGNLVLCRNVSGTMGGFGEYLSGLAAHTVKLPDTLSLADGALIEPLAIGRWGVRTSIMKPGDPVLVLGAGSIALGVIYWARLMGAGRIVVMSRSARRKNMALQFGADAFVQYGENEVAEVIEALGGKSPRVVFEAIGNPGFLGKGVQHAASLGQVVSMGFCTAPDSVIPGLVATKGVSMIFPVGYALEDFTETAKVMDKGHVDPKHMISSTVPLEDIQQAFERLRGSHNEVKVHVTMGGAG